MARSEMLIDTSLADELIRAVRQRLTTDENARLDRMIRVTAFGHIRQHVHCIRAVAENPLDMVMSRIEYRQRLHDNLVINQIADAIDMVRADAVGLQVGDDSDSDDHSEIVAGIVCRDTLYHVRVLTGIDDANDAIGLACCEIMLSSLAVPADDLVEHLETIQRENNQNRLYACIIDAQDQHGTDVDAIAQTVNATLALNTQPIPDSDHMQWSINNVLNQKHIADEVRLSMATSGDD